MEAARLTATIDADSKEGEAGLKRFHGLLGDATEGFKGLLATAGGFALGGGILAGIGAIGGFLHDAVTEGAAANEGIAQTEAVLKSTGGQAGVTADMVDKLANQYLNLTGIQDDTVRASENMLLTFTNIGKDVFPQATKTVLDMSVALGQDTKNSAIQLGKALNDPEKGLTALQRVGVTFTDQQKEQIKTMQQAGDLAGAQGVILKELNKEFGGSAESAGKANGGIKILAAQFDNLKQGIGQAIIPILVQLLTAVQPLAQWLGDHLPGAVEKASGWLGGQLGPVLQRVGSFIQSDVIPFVTKLADVFTTQVIPAAQRLADWVQSNLLPALGKVADFIIGSVLPTILKLASWLQANVLPVLGTLARTFMDDVLPALRNVWQSVSQNLLPALQHLLGVVLPVLNPILSTLGWILGNVVGPALSLVIGFVGEAIDVVATLIEKGVGLASAIGERVTPVVQALGTWFGEHLSPIIANVSSKLGELHQWFDAKVLPILQRLGSFIAGTILPILQRLAGEYLAAVQRGFSVIWGFVSDHILPILGQLAGLVKDGVGEAFRLFGAGLDAAGNAVGALLGKLGDLLGKLGELRDHLKDLPGVGGAGKALHIPGFAGGTQFAPGGPFLGAERGPELLVRPGLYSAPRGATIVNAQDTARLLGAGGGGGGNGGGMTVNIYPQKADLDADDLQTHLRRVALLGNTGGGY